MQVRQWDTVSANLLIKIPCASFISSTYQLRHVALQAALSDKDVASLLAHAQSFFHEVYKYERFPPVPLGVVFPGADGALLQTVAGFVSAVDEYTVLAASARAEKWAAARDLDLPKWLRVGFKLRAFRVSASAFLLSDPAAVDAQLQGLEGMKNDLNPEFYREQVQKLVRRRETMDSLRLYVVVHLPAFSSDETVLLERRAEEIGSLVTQYFFGPRDVQIN
jgi:hypothetical protein